MEVAAASDNIQSVFKHVTDTGGQRTAMGATAFGRIAGSNHSAQ